MGAAATDWPGQSKSDSDSGHVDRADRLYATVRTALFVWLLGYYLLPYTLLGRISPGGLLDEFGKSPQSIGLASALLFLAAIATTAPIRWKSGDLTAAHSQVHPPMWLITVAYAAPWFAGCVIIAARSEQNLESAAVLAALSTGLIAARLGRQSVVAGTTIIAAIQAVYSVVYQKEQINQLLSGSVPRAGGTFNDPNCLYTLMIIALPFAMAGVYRARNTLETFAYLVAASAELAALIMTWSRGGIVAAASGLLVFSYLTCRSKRITATLLVCFLTLACVVSMVRSSGEINQRSVKGANAARIGQWKSGWNAFMAHPLDGVGVNSFQLKVVTRHGARTDINVVNQSKNILLTWLAERGIGGGALFALFVGVVFAGIRRSLPNSIAAGAAAAWAALFVAGMVDTPMGMPERYAGNCCVGLLIGTTALLTACSSTSLRGPMSEDLLAADQTIEVVP